MAPKNDVIAFVGKYRAQSRIGLLRGLGLHARQQPRRRRGDLPKGAALVPSRRFPRALAPRRQRHPRLRRYPRLRSHRPRFPAHDPRSKRRAHVPRLGALRPGRAARPLAFTHLVLGAGRRQVPLRAPHLSGIPLRRAVPRPLRPRGPQEEKNDQEDLCHGTQGVGHVNGEIHDDDNYGPVGVLSPGLVAASPPDARGPRAFEAPDESEARRKALAGRRGLRLRSLRRRQERRDLSGFT